MGKFIKKINVKKERTLDTAGWVNKGGHDFTGHNKTIHLSSGAVKTMQQFMCQVCKEFVNSIHDEDKLSFHVRSIDHIQCEKWLRHAENMTMKSRRPQLDNVEPPKPDDESVNGKYVMKVLMETSNRLYKSNVLVMQNIHADVTDETLTEMLQEYNPQSLNIFRDGKYPLRVKVDFSTIEDANDCLQEFNGLKVLHGHTLYVQFLHPQDDRSRLEKAKALYSYDPEKTNKEGPNYPKGFKSKFVLFRHLSATINDKELFARISKIAPPKSVIIFPDLANPGFNIANVFMDNAGQARIVVNNLNGILYGGTRVSVTYEICCRDFKLRRGKGVHWCEVRRERERIHILKMRELDMSHVANPYTKFNEYSGFDPVQASNVKKRTLDDDHIKTLPPMLRNNMDDVPPPTANDDSDLSSVCSDGSTSEHMKDDIQVPECSSSQVNKQDDRDYAMHNRDHDQVQYNAHSTDYDERLYNVPQRDQSDSEYHKQQRDQATSQYSKSHKDQSAIQYNRDQGSSQYNRDQGSSQYNKDHEAIQYNRYQDSSQYNRDQGSSQYNRDQATSQYSMSHRDQSDSEYSMPYTDQDERHNRDQGSSLYNRDQGSSQYNRDQGSSQYNRDQDCQQYNIYNRDHDERQHTMSPRDQDDRQYGMQQRYMDSSSFHTSRQADNEDNNGSSGRNKTEFQCGDKQYPLQHQKLPRQESSLLSSIHGQNDKGQRISINKF